MSRKRKAPDEGLARPTKEKDWDAEAASVSSDDDVSEVGVREDEDDESEEEEDDENDEDPTSGSEDASSEEEDRPIDFSSLPLGELASSSDLVFGDIAKLIEVQEAIRSLMGKTSRKDFNSSNLARASSMTFGQLKKLAKVQLNDIRRASQKSQHNDTGDEPGNEGAPQEQTSKRRKTDRPPKRTSKHAPQEVTSKVPVSRRRDYGPDPRRQFRDPRFDPAVDKGVYDEAKTRKNYAFLDEWRDQEMADLRAKIKATKAGPQKDELKTELHSMESKKRAQGRKDENEALIKSHKQKEKELVAQGKTPYYLKKQEQQKTLHTERFNKMTKAQADHVVERRRKKAAGKEKKAMGELESRSR